jgi:hypothetical protein
MSDAATLQNPTLESLAAAVRSLQNRLQDMEDLIELRAAVENNADKPGLPWEQVKAELDLDPEPPEPTSQRSKSQRPE